MAALALCVVLGLLTSVGVAWGVALQRKQVFTFGHMVNIDISPAGERFYGWSFDFKDSYRPALTRVELGNNPGTRSTRTVLIDNHIAQRAQTAIAKLRVREDRKLPHPNILYPERDPQWPSWLRLPLQDERFVSMSARASGWPWLCLVHRSFENEDGTRRSRGGLRVRGSGHYVNIMDPDAGMVPLLPVWPGLVANTAVFSGAWLAGLVLPWMGWSAWRRGRRVRRGLCAVCGYDLGGRGVCPECGSGDSRSGMLGPGGA
jgi:hypothetical protein